tara:strand:+ start:576 stop:1688 length:1113 start_codon:yes stop_codon:yes gene_type:complete
VFLFNQFSISAEKIKIGLIVPLSGKHELIGKSILNSAKLALMSINNNNIEILPRDSKSDPMTVLNLSKELYSNYGVKIIIGPVFNKSGKFLNQIPQVTFLSLTNKLMNNHSNVISAGVNAMSQINTIKKFLKNEELRNTIFLIPNSKFKIEVEKAIMNSKIKIKDKFVYSTDPTLLTKEVSKITKYSTRKQNLIDEIKRLEKTNEVNKDRKLEILKKRDTLGGINFDSIIVADFDQNLKSVLTSFLYTDVSSKRVKYISFNHWFDKSLLKEVGLHPIYFPSVDKENYNYFINKYEKNFNIKPNHLSFLSYDLVGLTCYLIIKNNYEIKQNMFFEKNLFKGKIGVFEINKNKIIHRLSFYSTENNGFKKIF